MATKFIVHETDGYHTTSKTEFQSRFSVAYGQLKHLDTERLRMLRAAIQQQIDRQEAVERELAPVLGGEG